MNLRTSLLLLTALALSACRSGQSYPSVGVVPTGAAAFHALVPAGARLERLAGGFAWAEGPIWRKSGGYLLFSDIPKNTVYRWDDHSGLTVFLRPSGYTAPDPPGRELGANGVKLDGQDRVVMANHGDRAIERLDESNYTRIVLAARYQGKRLNSPNDLAVRSNGDIYFTDPPYGLKGLNADPAKELPFSGVYRLTPSGELTLLTRELTFPNGIAFSPDERTLYVSNSDPEHAVWMAYPVQADGSIGAGRVLFDATSLAKQGLPGLPDGLVIDRQGNLFAGGPGGVLVITPEGRHLGTIATRQPTANVAFGGDGSDLYMTSDTLLLRVRTSTRGKQF
ncbi:MAG TPA: SMP-30/gluconolactonase/LRE family protein [Longimicrobiales bacterium]